MTSASTNPPGTPTPTPEAEVEILSSKGTRQRRSSSEVRNYDFRESGFLAASELRGIRQRHEQFVRSLGSRLGIYLRLEFALRLSKIQILSYQQFTEQLGTPTHLSLFRIDPLEGVGLLVIPPRLSLGLVDRLLGGPGQLPAAGRDLTEIEIALTDQIAGLLLTEWGSHWPELRQKTPTLLGHESNGRYLQTSPPEAAVLVMTIETGMGEPAEIIQLAFPYAMIEPLVRQLSPSVSPSEPVPARLARLQWNHEFDDMKVKTSAEWHGLRVSADELSRLRPGDVLMLSPGSAGKVQLCLSQVPKFLGQPGVSGDKWAIQLTEIINA